MKQNSDPDGGDRAPFLSGGDGKMHSYKPVAAQTPGQSSQEGSGGGNGPMTAGAPGAGFYSSGATNKDYAGPQASGTSGPTKKGGDAKFAAGGTTPMFGNRGSQPAVAGRSSCAN